MPLFYICQGVCPQSVKMASLLFSSCALIKKKKFAVIPPIQMEGDSMGSFWLGLNLHGDHREQGILLAPDPSPGTPGSCLSFFLAFRNTQKSLCKGSRLTFQNVHSAIEKRRGRSLTHTCKESAAVERTWMCPPLVSPCCWLPAAWR